jgi:hypothetical protein
MLCVTRRRACADRCGKDRDVLRIGKLARAFAIVRCRAMDLRRNGTEKLFEDRGGLRKLGGEIPYSFVSMLTS